MYDCWCLLYNLTLQNEGELQSNEITKNAELPSAWSGNLSCQDVVWAGPILFLHWPVISMENDCLILLVKGVRFSLGIKLMRDALLYHCDVACC